MKTSIAQILEVILKLAVLPVYVYVATKWTLTLFQTYVHWLFWRNLASTAIKRQGRAADSVLESQTQFLKMWHYLSGFFFSMQAVLTAMWFACLEQLFDLLLMLKSTVFCFIFLFLEHDFALVFVYHSWKSAGRGKSVHCTEHATESLFSFQGLYWELHSARI